MHRAVHGIAFFSMKNPPDLPGIPGMLSNAAHRFRKATQILPPIGLGIGIGIGVGCGFGWPLRHAYGAPRALCGPAIAAGVGFGYGQGMGRRFGIDHRPKAFTDWIKQVEIILDVLVLQIVSLFQIRSSQNNGRSVLQHNQQSN